MAKAKNNERGIAIIFGIGVIKTVSLNLIKSQDVMEYKMNTGKMCIRQDWKGNVLINRKFQNEKSSYKTKK